MSFITAQQRVKVFRHQFSDAHYYLALHASFPLALTPDWLYRCWASFSQDTEGQPLDIPWIAVADLLLSNFCKEVGFELFRLDEEVQDVLLKALYNEPRFGPSRIAALDSFNHEYFRSDLQSQEAEVSDYARTQIHVSHWIAIARIKPELAREQIKKENLLSGIDSDLWMRLAGFRDSVNLRDGNQEIGGSQLNEVEKTTDSYDSYNRQVVHSDKWNDYLGHKNSSDDTDEVGQTQTNNKLNKLISNKSFDTKRYEVPITDNFDTYRIQIVEKDDIIAYEHLTLYSKEDRLLIKDLTISIPYGTRLLISGSNEEAKIALFRATASMNDLGEGKIIRPNLDKIGFLSQRAYLYPGTLRELLVRSGEEHKVSDQQILRALMELRLEEVLKRAGGLDVEQDWGNLLSLGEEQLLAFTRLLLAKPRFAFLDRVYTALSAEHAAQILLMLSMRKITYIALDESNNIPELYDVVLEINRDGSWQFEWNT